MASMKFRARVAKQQEHDLIIRVTRPCRALSILPGSYVDVVITPVRDEAGYLRSDAVASSTLSEYFEREGDEDRLDFGQGDLTPLNYVDDAEERELESLDYAPVKHMKDIVAIPAPGRTKFVTIEPEESNEDNVDLDIGVDWDELEDCEIMRIPIDRETRKEVGRDVPDKDDEVPSKNKSDYFREELE